MSVETYIMSLEDELCQHLLQYSENVTYNSSSAAALSQVSRELACCNDYQDALVSVCWLY